MDKYKASNGRRLTQGLFYEFNNPDAPYTLRDEDFTNAKGVTYKSAAAIYRSCVDEYDAAMKIVGSWAHWKMLLNLDWFVNGADLGGYDFDGIKAWREEMALRDASHSKALLQEQAENGNVTAQRYLNESSNKTTKAGRPAKPKVVKQVSNIESLYNKVKNG